ncbi:VOC family protein [Hyphococcus luteus]|nr:VOC family protein [Marinicaulis flavus]
MFITNLNARGVAAGLALAVLTQGAAVAEDKGAAAADSGLYPTPLEYGPPTGMAWFNRPKVDDPEPIKPNKAGVYGLEHTHLFVADMEKSLHFYVDILGFEQVMKIQDISEDPPMNDRMNVLLGQPGAQYRHAIVTMPGGPSYGTHVPQIEFWEIKGVPLDETINENPTANIRGKGYNAYMVTDLDAILAKMKKAGIRFVSEPLVSPRGKSIYVVDPDGQVIELNERYSDAAELEE